MSPASHVHVAHELEETTGSVAQCLVFPRPAGHQQQRVEDLVVQPGRMTQRIVPASDRIGQARTEFGLPREVLTEMREAERHVARFVLGGEPRNRRGYRIRGIALDEPEQGQEGSLQSFRTCSPR
jgi:hypothetical protein